ncbi:MAG TPA: hypothetical protein VGW34_03305 [Allosphingosinicella sp.]|nr:hypothetical protein [Allosphingosinicella sp.]
MTSLVWRSAIEQKPVMTRPIPLAFLLVAVACGGSDAVTDRTTPSSKRIACAVDGAAALAPVCTAERSAGAEGTILTLRHPSGGFRRLLIATDGRGVVAADGAARPVVTAVAADEIEVALGGDRYRLPATVRPR